MKRIINRNQIYPCHKRICYCIEYLHFKYDNEYKKYEACYYQNIKIDYKYNKFHKVSKMKDK